MAIATPTRRGFSLLELLIVVAITATVTAVLLPAISKIRRGTNDLACQNNIRQVLMALTYYNNDHQGSMPYGFYYRTSHPVTWQQPIDGIRGHVSWAEALNPYVAGRAEQLGSVFQCPLALQTQPHRIGYAMNMIVAVSPLYELVFGPPPNAQMVPSKVNLMRKPGTALLWDTPLKPNTATTDGYLVGGDIDAQRFWEGALVPQHRYYLAHDPYGQVPPGNFGNTRPIILSVGSIQYRNIDPPDAAAFPWQGNLRFRHNDNTACNVGFSDGTVRQYTAVLGANDTVTSHNAIRQDFMTNWPPGVTPNPAFPH